MATITSFAGFKVQAVKVDKIDPIIFKTQIVSPLSNGQSAVCTIGQMVRDGDDVYTVDTRKNTSTKVTPKSLAEMATKAATDQANSTGADNNALSFQEGLGTIASVTFAKDTDNCQVVGGINRIASSLNLKVTDVTVDAQDTVIFATAGVKSLSGLEKHNGEYYKLDLKKNTATVVNPDALASTVKDDILDQKFNTDMVRFAESFGLVSAITFERKA